MGVAERKSRERADRERRITAVARAVAEQEGWGAVTIRRLAEEIEYSQPVLYSHFDSRDAIVAAVAVEGFRDLGSTLRQAARRSADRPTALGNVARAYLAFAQQQPALYEAMFTMRTDLRFSEVDSKAELKEAFAALAAVLTPTKSDAAAATETFWATLHGLAELERSGRIRPGAREDRLALVIRGFIELHS